MYNFVKVMEVHVQMAERRPFRPGNQARLLDLVRTKTYTRVLHRSARATRLRNTVAWE